MSKIHTLKISNFRSIKNFEQVFGSSDFICLIGRGDSGKTTILEAISYVLSPSWNLPFYDTDFHMANIETPIEIEATLYDLPKSMLSESKLGLHIRGIDKITNKIYDDIEDSHESAITIKLVVEKDLEPKWLLVKDTQEETELKATDRAAFNIYLVSDYIDKHFSWSNGSPLYTLLKEDNKSSSHQKYNIIIDEMRKAKGKIDEAKFSHIDSVTDKIKVSATKLGVDISDTLTTIDFKDIAIRDGKICLHQEKIPFRLKGKGSKRLISIAIQIELASIGGIILIDEIEQGLEPDRAQHLVKTLKNIGTGQVFVSTHSRDVLVELQAENLFLMKQGNTSLNTFNSELQGCLRRNPEAFFSRKVIICEGATEIGFCRGLNDYRIFEGKENAAFLGVRFADGTGANMIEYAKSFKASDFEVCLFCDSDVVAINDKKQTLIELGIKIIDCELNNSTEQQVFNDLPWDAVVELIAYQKDKDIFENTKSSIGDQYKKTHGSILPDNWDSVEVTGIRGILGLTAKKNNWFKRIDYGEFMGELCCKNISLMGNNRLKNQVHGLSKWIDNA